MALVIEDAETERLVQELAQATGESLADAVRLAIEERLTRLSQHRSIADELMAIGRHCAALADDDTRSADEILGYDENGLPT